MWTPLRSVFFTFFSLSSRSYFLVVDLCTVSISKRFYLKASEASLQKEILIPTISAMAL
jgi:hypothetical protein